MVIHGKDRKFLLTIGASADIADLCPDGDMTQIGEIFAKASFAEQVKFTIKMAIAMNRGYEENKAFEIAGYEEDVITEKELRTLTPDQLQELSSAVLAAYRGDMSGEIEAEPEKKREITTAPEA